LGYSDYWKSQPGTAEKYASKVSSPGKRFSLNKLEEKAGDDDSLNGTPVGHGTRLVNLKLNSVLDSGLGIEARNHSSRRELQSIKVPGSGNSQTSQNRQGCHINFSNEANVRFFRSEILVRHKPAVGQEIHFNLRE
jgi:hypothetical protein